MLNTFVIVLVCAAAFACADPIYNVTLSPNASGAFDRYRGLLFAPEGNYSWSSNPYGSQADRNIVEDRSMFAIVPSSFGLCRDVCLNERRRLLGGLGEDDICPEDKCFYGVTSPGMREADYDNDDDDDHFDGFRQNSKHHSDAYVIDLEHDVSRAAFRFNYTLHPGNASSSFQVIGSSPCQPWTVRPGDGLVEIVLNMSAPMSRYVQIESVPREGDIVPVLITVRALRGGADEGVRYPRPPGPPGTDYNTQHPFSSKTSLYCSSPFNQTDGLHWLYLNSNDDLDIGPSPSPSPSPPSPPPPPPPPTRRLLQVIPPPTPPLPTPPITPPPIPSASPSPSPGPELPSEWAVRTPGFYAASPTADFSENVTYVPANINATCLFDSLTFENTDLQQLIRAWVPYHPGFVKLTMQIYRTDGTEPDIAALRAQEELVCNSAPEFDISETCLSADDDDDDDGFFSSAGGIILIVLLAALGAGLIGYVIWYLCFRNTTPYNPV